MNSTLPPTPDADSGATPEAFAADAIFVAAPAPVVAAPFEQLNLPAAVIANLTRLGYHAMTPIN